MSMLADALQGATGRFVKWDDLGRNNIVTGSVIRAELRQCRSFDTKELETWNDGTPKNEALISIQTTNRVDADDDGARTIVVNLWGQQKRALADACKTAGVPEPRPGDEFSAVWTAGAGGSRDPRQFAYKVVPGTGLGAALDDPFAGLPAGNPPTPTPAPAAAPAPAPATAAPAPVPATAGPSGVELATQLLKLGVTQPQAAQASGLDPATIAALANAITAGNL